MNIDRCTGLGFSLELLSKSDYHRNLPARDYLFNQILPAMKVAQIRFYCTDSGIPTALVTWAWLSESVETEVLTTGRALHESEWNCGSRLFFNDFVAPYDNSRQIAKDLLGNLFLNEEYATSLRRNADGSVRRINYWTGKAHNKIRDRHSKECSIPE